MTARQGYQLQSTSLTLLEELRLGADPNAWELFSQLYRDPILHWAKLANLDEADAEDVTQEVLLTIYRNIRNFSRAREGSFRRWIRRTLQMIIRRHLEIRRGIPLDHLGEKALEVAGGDQFITAQDYYQRVMESAIHLLFREFEPMSWRLFLDTISTSTSVADLARIHNVSANSIYIARFRIINRLTQICGGLMEDGEAFPLGPGMVEEILASSTEYLKNKLSKGFSGEAPAAEEDLPSN